MRPILFFVLLTVFCQGFADTAQAGWLRDRMTKRAADKHTETHQMNFGGFDREYILYAPPARTTNAVTAPLVIVLHGTGEKMQKHLGFNPYAR